MGYNMMTCSGFSTAIMGGCSISWLILAVLVILAMIANRQINDLGQEWNQWGGYIGAVVPYVVVISITGNVKIGAVVGLIGMLLGGFLAGQFLGGEE